jgi:photosystem II stability/assembly factor-like uncharacterized protein
MSFTQSNLNSGEFKSVSIFGSNGIAGSGTDGIYYTSNNGQFWTRARNTSDNSFMTGAFNSIVLSGSNGLAGTGSNGVWYSNNSGETWTLSNISSGFGALVSLSGTRAIATTVGNGLYYSTTSGSSWIRSNRQTSEYYDLYLSGLNGIAAGGAGDNTGLFYTTDGGVNFERSNPLTGPVRDTIFNSVFISGLNGIAGNADGYGIYYTTDGGINWQVSNKSTGIFKSVTLSGSNGIAAGYQNNGIWFTKDYGINWAPSNISSGFFKSVSLSGIRGIAGSESNGIYITNDGGETWTQTNIASGSINMVSINTSNKGIAASFDGFGVYYGYTFICYEKNTLILVLDNKQEVYKKICELKVGDMVKTYKQGYKKIKKIKSFKYTNNNPSVKKCLYKMRGHNIIVTANHGILVDKLSDQEVDEAKKFKIVIKKIEDKYLLPACVCDNFDKIINDKEYELWHFALENDDINKNYGVYITDNILSESCSEAVIDE